MQVNYKLWLGTTKKFYGGGPQQLLMLIDQTGSLNVASKKMDLSYKKALLMIARAEQQLGFKLLERTIGGATGGGSQLTNRARHWMMQYAAIERAVDEVVAAEWQKICRQNFADAILAPLVQQLSAKSNQFISIIGGGGKTTLQDLLWDRLHRQFDTLYTTTTKMRPRHDIETHYGAAPRRRSVALYQALIGRQKVCGVPPQQLDRHYRAGDYQLVICEADGSRGRPFKLYNADEPVVAAATTQLFIVVGCDAFILPVVEGVHRPQYYSGSHSAPLGLFWALDYLCQTIAEQATSTMRVTIVFNKYQTYPLAVDIMTVVERLKRCRRQLSIITAELARAECYHHIELE